MARRFRTVAVTLFLAFLAAGAALSAAPQDTPQQPDVRAGEVAVPAWPREAVRAPQAMVVSDEPLASAAGVEILKKGGNAVDAAVAVAFALAVVEPAAGNLGGGGFMLVRMADGRAGFVDYRETASGRATRDMYVGPGAQLDAEAATVGYRSVAIPGTVAGLELALRTYGSMRLAEVMAPAIRLAENGVPVSEKLARSLRAARPVLQRFSVSRRIFLKDGALYQTGEILRQPELAATLRHIARRGSAEFYRGETARELADEIAHMGGLISREDLAGYKAKVRKPLIAKYRIDGAEWEVISSPPPSSGGIAIIEALNILEPIELKSWSDPQTVHWVAETLRRVFADRAAYLADADFAEVPVRGLTDPRYAAELRATIDPLRASLSSEVRAGNPMPFDSARRTGAPAPACGPKPACAKRSGGGKPFGGRRPAAPGPQRQTGSSSHTTHFSVVDRGGNAVANTYTLNESYGSGVTVSAGFLLNDTMDDFTTQPGTPNKLFGLVQSDANTIAPGKRPLSSMAPTILLRNGKLSFVTGSPGGPQIISATLLSLLGWMRLGGDAQAIINAPRFHHQWLPDELRVEPAFPAEVRAALVRRGHTVVVRSWIGQVEAIGIDPNTGDRMGAADPRRQGVAAGY